MFLKVGRRNYPLRKSAVSSLGVSMVIIGEQEEEAGDGERGWREIPRDELKQVEEENLKMIKINLEVSVIGTT
jgi:hypothetical protein